MATMAYGGDFGRVQGHCGSTMPKAACEAAKEAVNNYRPAIDGRISWKLFDTVWSAYPAKRGHPQGHVGIDLPAYRNLSAPVTHIPNIAADVDLPGVSDGNGGAVVTRFPRFKPIKRPEEHPLRSVQRWQEGLFQPLNLSINFRGLHRP